MSWIREKEVTGINSDDDKYKLVALFNEYFDSLIQDDELTFSKAVANNMLIGCSYRILENSELWDEVLMKNMQIIREEVLKNKLGREVFPDPTLINTAFSVYFVWKNTNYFGKFVYSLNNYIIDLTNTYIHYFYENKKSIGYNFFSLSFGLTGICNYLLEFGSEYQVIIEEIIKILVYVTNEESETLDFSLSNGMGGMLSVMVKAYNNNIVTPGQKEAMDNILSVYQKYAISRDNSTYWPGILKLNSQVDLIEACNMKETWAYGALAIARVIQLAGICILDEGLIELSSKIILNKSRLLSQEFAVMNASLFSGYSGLLCLFDAISRKDSSIEFYKIKNELLKVIMDSYIKKPRPGFKLKKIHLISERITELEICDNDTINAGNTGIMLSLITSFSAAEQTFYPYMGIC